MKRILLVCGRHNYGDPKRGLGYEYSNFLPALESMGFEVSFFDSRLRTEFTDFGELNSSLVDAATAIRPDVIFTVLTHFEVWLQTLDVLRALPSRVINWATDDSWRYSDFGRHVAPHVTVQATTYKSAFDQYREIGGVNPYLTQWAATSADLQAPTPSRRCSIPVSFIGSAYGGRARAIHYLIDNGIDVECFGQGWDNGPIGYDRLKEIVQASVVSLGFTTPSFKPGRWPKRRAPQIKARTFQVPGLGGFLATESAPGLSRYYDLGNEIQEFRSREEMLHVVRRILVDPRARDEGAVNAWQRTASQHVYEKRFAALLAFAFSIPVKVSPLGAEELRSTMSALRAEHALSPLQQRAKHVLDRFGQIYPSSRAARGLRRASHAATVTLRGSKAYRARAITGRLFYEAS